MSKGFIADLRARLKARPDTEHQMRAPSLRAIASTFPQRFATCSRGRTPRA